MSVEFLVKVLPWPGEGEPGYINLHWIERGKNGMPGRPCASPVKLYEQRDFYGKDNKPVDFYICLSLQTACEERTSKTTGRKYRAAVRLHSNVLALKSLFIDVDEKNYPDAKSLLLDFQRFRHETSLPFPSAIVHSGGGYHFYWSFNRNVSLTEWQPLANALANAIKQHGLKADTQCTVDAARVLRLPATFNYKYDPPRKVVVKHIDENDFTFEALAAKLAPYQQAATAQPVFLNGLPPLGPPVANNLAAGIEAPHYLVPAENLIHECPLFADAVKTKGAGYGNPLWNLTTLLATFMENGPALARIMSKGHKTYTEEETDALYSRKEKEKADRNIGWPTCKAFSDAGSTLCKTCPNFAKNQSPLNFAKKNGVKVATPSTIQTINVPGYIYEQGLFYRLHTSKDDPSVQLKTLVYNSHIINFRIPPTAPGSEPCLEMCVPEARKRPISVPLSILGGPRQREFLQANGMVHTAEEAKEMGPFMPAFAKALKKVEKDANVEICPSGWNFNEEAGELDGFSYAGTCYGEKGTRPAPLLDQELQKQYTPRGIPTHWRAAADLIIDKDRHDINCIIAAAPAGPLVGFTGLQGIILSAHGRTARGKSTAVKLGQSMFGDPIKGVYQLDDTNNSMFNKLASLGALTCYFDETRITPEKASMFFRITAGKDKARLDSNSKQRAVSTWNTLFVATSNDGLVSVTDKREEALLRVFEFPVKPSLDDVATFIDVNSVTSKLSNNYGHFAREYAPFLAHNMRRIEGEVRSMEEHFMQVTSAGRDERFWIATMACLVLGSRYSNELGYTKFDLDGMEAFLIGAMNTMRNIRVTETINVTNIESVYIVLMEYVNLRQPATLKVDQVFVRGGKSVPLNGADLTGRLLRVQIGEQDHTLRISLSDFKDWCAKEKKLPPQSVIGSLKEHLFMSVVRSRIGAGTVKAAAPEDLMHFDMTKWPQHMVFD